MRKRVGLPYLERRRRRNRAVFGLSFFMGIGFLLLGGFHETIKKNDIEYQRCGPDVYL